MIKFKVNYFDLGLYRGQELKWIVEDIFPRLNITNYEAYGFEACKSYSDSLKKYFSYNDKVNILNKAISDEEGEVKLYYSPNALGHSIFSSKNNVNPKKFEVVNSVKFSDWISSNVADFENSFNILKVNIEGAEWQLFNDICSCGLSDKIHIFCGAGHDVEKVRELKDKVGEYYSILEKNNIHLFRFTEWKPHQNADIEYEIKKAMIEFYRKTEEQLEETI